MRLEVSQSHQRFNKHLSNYLVSFCAEFINNSSVQKVTLSGRNQSCIKDPQLIVPQFSMNHLQGQCWQTICLLHLPVISYANLIKYWLITLNPYQSPLWPWLKWIDNWVTTSAVQPLLRNHGLLSLFHTDSDMWRETQLQNNLTFGEICLFAFLTEVGEDTNFILCFQYRLVLDMLSLAQDKTGSRKEQLALLHQRCLQT